MKNIMSGKPVYTGPCIYSITNDVNKRVYIGSTRNAKARYLGHLAAMRRMKGENPGILSDLKSGHTFTFKIEKEFPMDIPQITLNDMEASAIRETENSYNISSSIVTTEKLLEFMNLATSPAKKYIYRYVRSIAYAFHYRDSLVKSEYQQTTYGAEQIDAAANELCQIVKEAAKKLKETI